VHPGARDTTHGAIVKPGTPIVRVDELGERFAACLGVFHMGKPASSSFRLSPLSQAEQLRQFNPVNRLPELVLTRG
jgi:hypothetical protein